MFEFLNGIAFKLRPEGTEFTAETRRGYWRMSANWRGPPAFAPVILFGDRVTTISQTPLPPSLYPSESCSIIRGQSSDQRELVPPYGAHPDGA